MISKAELDNKGDLKMKHIKRTISTILILALIAGVFSFIPAPKAYADGGGYSMESADWLELGLYNYVRADNEKEHFWYKFSLDQETEIHIGGNSNIYSVSYTLYNDRGVELASETVMWDDYDAPSVGDRFFKLEKGTYYIEIYASQIGYVGAVWGGPADYYEFSVNNNFDPSDFGDYYLQDLTEDSDTSISSTQDTSSQDTSTQDTSAQEPSGSEKSRYTIMVLETAGKSNFYSGGRKIYTSDSAVKYVKKSANVFLNELQKGTGKNHIAVVTYDSDGRIKLDFTTNTGKVKKAIKGINSASSGSVNLSAGINKAQELVNGLSADKSEINVVLFTTGLVNSGSYDSYGVYDSSVVGHDWVNSDTEVNLYKYANSAIDNAKTLRQNANLYVLGLFQTMQGMPKAGKEVKTLFKKTAKDLAGSSKLFYDVADVNTLDVSFENVANIVSGRIAKPRNVSRQNVTKIGVGGNSMTVKWKQEKNAVGYELQICDKSNFKNNTKTYRIPGNGTTVYVVLGLKSGKRYYSRVRSYTKYHSGNGKLTIVYGKWSKKKRSKKIKSGKYQTADQIADVYRDDFVFPDSSRKYVSESKIKKLSLDEVQRAINEIYARNGYKFSSEEWDKYFRKFSWYKPRLNMEDAANRFNKYERKNMDLLIKRRDELRKKL